MYRILEKKDIPKVCDLMEEIRPAIAGLHSRFMYSAICKEALINDRLIMTVAEDQTNIIAFTVAIVDNKRFWKIFALQHPLLATIIAVRRLLDLKTMSSHSKLPKTTLQEPVKREIYTAPSNHSWKDSSPKIAKLSAMAVAKEYRGKHVAQGLENYRLKLLRKRNIKRADLLMAPSNTAVIGLARKVGFRIIGTYRGLLFGTIDLEKIE